MSAAFKVGDAVTIQDVLLAGFRSHIGRRGTLKRFTPAGGYVVQIGGPRGLLILATAVESVIETLASAKDQSDYIPGDTVRIVQTRHNDGRSRAVVGKVGTIENIFYWNGRPDTFFVEVDGETYPAAKVEPAPAADPSPSEPAKDQSDYATGDRVRIVQARYNDGRGRASVGKVGVIRRTGSRSEARGSTPLYSVLADDGEIYIATAVEKVADPAPGPYTVRLQAAKDASAILGENADETEIEMLGEWLLNERPVATAKPVREPIDDQTFTGWYERLGAQGARSFFITNASDPAPTSKPDADETARELEKATALTEPDLDIGELNVSVDLTADDDVVAVSTDGTEYLKEEQVDELVVYLQAAKLRHVARREARES